MSSDHRFTVLYYRNALLHKIHINSINSWWNLNKHGTPGNWVGDTSSDAINKHVDATGKVITNYKRDIQFHVPYRTKAWKGFHRFLIDHQIITTRKDRPCMQYWSKKNTKTFEIKATD